MFNRILVPLDGSSFAEAALPAAFALARRTGAQIRLLSVIEPGSAPASRPPRLDYLERMGRGRAPLEAEVTAAVREGPVHQEILAEAESWRAHLIVMATHGRGGVSRLWIGSVSDQCLRRARVPLLLVRALPAEIRIPGGAFAPRRVVVPLDGSERSATALGPATAVAGMFGAALELIRVVPKAGLDAEAERARARAYLDDVSRRLRTRGPTVAADVIADGNPATAIIARAEGDLVVMATQARPEAQRVLLGGVTDKVVRGAIGSVLVIPPRVRPEDGLDARVAHCLDAGLEPGHAEVPFGGAFPWELP